MNSPEPAVVVRVAMVRREEMQETISRIGSIRATELVEVSPEIPGIVRQVCFDEGDTVEIDHLLFSLDDRKLKKQIAAQDAALVAARSRAEFAALMYDRYDQLLDEDAAAAADRDRRKTELEAIRAEIDRLEAERALLQERLRDTEIRAPMRGVVSESQVDKGDFVRAGQTLAVLYSPSLEARSLSPKVTRRELLTAKRSTSGWGPMPISRLMAWCRLSVRPCRKRLARF